MINKRQKHKSKNSKSTKNTKNIKTRKNKKNKKQTKQVQIPKPEGGRKEKDRENGKRNGLLWCPVPYVWELDLLNSNHV